MALFVWVTRGVPPAERFCRVSEFVAGWFLVSSVGIPKQSSWKAHGLLGVRGSYFQSPPNCSLCSALTVEHLNELKNLTWRCLGRRKKKQRDKFVLCVCCGGFFLFILPSWCLPFRLEGWTAALHAALDYFSCSQFCPLTFPHVPFPSLLLILILFFFFFFPSPPSLSSSLTVSLLTVMVLAAFSPDEPPMLTVTLW